MSGKDEMSYAIQIRREEEREAERERQGIRRNRNNKIKRWTGKLSTIIFTVLVCFLVYSFLVGPVSCSMSSTIVTGEGNFDKIAVNYEMVGDSTTKIFFVMVEAPGEEFIGITNSFSFYNRSIDFFITVYTDGLAQSSEHFILRTEGIEAVSCKKQYKYFLYLWCDKECGSTFLSNKSDDTFVYNVNNYDWSFRLPCI